MSDLTETLKKTVAYTVGGGIVGGPAGAGIGAATPIVQRLTEMPNVNLPMIKPTLMPVPNSLDIQRQKRRTLAELQQRQGRASTILSDTSGNKLGA